MKKILIIGCSVLALTACKNEKKEVEETEMVEKTEMKSSEETQEEWQELFNGQDLEGWKAFNKDSISGQWKVEDGAISFTPAEGKREKTENLISEEEFESFELSLEWKISEGGNSGIMWAVQEDEKYNEPYLTGPEIQVLDNQKHPDAKNGPNRTAGALYDMVPPSEDATKPAGEWNKETIHIDYEANKGWVELNGTRVTEFPVKGEEWKNMVSKSKFSEWEGFGTTPKGHIALQDHGDKVWYRNIKIKQL
ncbi:DUF1080 domain-containing protein [Christiangramia sp. SM2212]|uniref:DUF1080 domain-containing protein n=1 Tax=Christiangramia sediminicola TaxID=3073267 RepID=A0ABU1ENN9_9FLAO|nr:DUF1080 domain-containing protein [Christiangramia sp. SM2212]MDR5590002.1 DUF1080 domain-containing protein [Christiangramia sp. SM2212]